MLQGISFLQEMTRIQFAMASTANALRIARRLSGYIWSQIDNDQESTAQFVIGSLGSAFFSYLVCANTSASGWSSYIKYESVFFVWSLESEAASDGGW